MSKKSAKKQLSDYALVIQDIHKVIDIMGENSQVRYIEPGKVAAMVINLWQNGNVIDIRIKWAAVEEIKEIARDILRKYEPCLPESEAYQGTFGFKQLQAWYPLPGQTGKYWRLELLTPEALSWNIERLRKHSRACLKHADALESYATRQSKD